MARPRQKFPTHRIVRIPGRNSLYLSWTENGSTKLRSLRTMDTESAQRTADALNREQAIRANADSRELKSVLVDRLKGARRRASKTGRKFSLCLGDLLDMWRRERGRCAVSGVPLSISRDGRGKNPFAPSLDRIDSRKGYVVGNVRLVCCAVNFFMGDWGDEVLRQIVFSMASRAGAKLRTVARI